MRRISLPAISPLQSQAARRRFASTDADKPHVQEVHSLLKNKIESASASGAAANATASRSRGPPSAVSVAGGRRRAGQFTASEHAEADESVENWRVGGSLQDQMRIKGVTFKGDGAQMGAVYGDTATGSSMAGSVKAARERSPSRRAGAGAASGADGEGKAPRITEENEDTPEGEAAEEAIVAEFDGELRLLFLLVYSFPVCLAWTRLHSLVARFFRHPQYLFLPACFATNLTICACACACAHVFLPSQPR
jgi:hypothetical protein